MTANLIGAGGLAVLLFGAALGVLLDVPNGPIGWRRGGPWRWLLIFATLAVLVLAAYASWLRLHP
jgi:hypothetical protein